MQQVEFVVNFVKQARVADVFNLKPRRMMVTNSKLHDHIFNEIIENAFKSTADQQADIFAIQLTPFSSITTDL